MRKNKLNKKKAYGAVTTILPELYKLPEVKEDYFRFYRGQPVDDSPKPSIFRKEVFNNIEEDEIFYEVVSKKPEEFLSCQSTFDFLVKMQHYELPTRLLDITSNPLVALYFTLSEKPEPSKKRVLYVFDVKKDLIKNFNSDNVTILSNLARCDSLVKKNIEEQIKRQNTLIEMYWTYIDSVNKNNTGCGYSFKDKFENNKNDVAEDFLSNALFIKHQTREDFLSKNLSCKNTIITNFNNILNEANNTDISEKNVISVFSSIRSESLLHEIKQDKPYFQDKINKTTFETIFCVNPKLDNNRVIAQSGAFLLFPSDIEFNKMADSIKTYEFEIDNRGVTWIQNQLSLLNIKEDTLFNELDKVCASIKYRYMNKKK